MKKVIVVCGPTATGKSDYAVELALKIHGEVVSADSRQIYKGLDIGSGKITVFEMKGVPHHMLNVADPRDIYSAADYARDGKKILEDILSRNKIPIICGGTGFYINALVFDQSFPAVLPNESLRKELERLSLEELQEKLKELDPERYSAIDIQNRVRIVRAIEIASELGSVPPLIAETPYDIEWVYLDFPDEVLKERIHRRLYKRLEEGMIEEVQSLHEKGVSWERLEALGLEYRYISLFLQDKLSKEDMLNQLEFEIWHYAKRQRTWFKKYISIN